LHGGLPWCGMAPSGLRRAGREPAGAWAPRARGWCLAAGGLVPARQLEGPEGATLSHRLGQLGHVAAPQRHGAAIADGHADVLLAVLLPGDGRGDDAATGLEAPQLLAV